MTTLQRQLKFRGRVAPDDVLHQIVEAPDEHYIAPKLVQVNIVQPPGHKPIGVPQYSHTVYGGKADSYNPAGDCDGNFMSYKFKPNNNCYAYGTNIATNSFPQPGRKSGYLITADDLQKPLDEVGELVKGYAVQDGLIYVGKTMDELMQYKSNNSLEGHFVALLISPAGDDNWPGDYHWVRCDNSSEKCDSWSQKDSSDQITNFDFAGHPITDPATANWTVNEGPVVETSVESTTKPSKFVEYTLCCEGSQVIGTSAQPVQITVKDKVVEYSFYCYMFVPNKGVDII